ncbi:MAG: chromosomal replication initiation protein DnaA, partial [Acidiferrobacteraceae bacterium]|nr:chromosomal replication initiation protein DnaA [Acidiferrobacteraceae bacterium]
MQEPIWPLCLTRLENDLPIQQFNTWIRPLQAIEKEAGLTLLAPNRYVRDTVERDYLGHIAGLANNFRHRDIAISIDIGSDHPPRGPDKTTATPRPVPFKGRLNPAFTFVSHVAGKSNQLARAAAQQVGENPGRAYNPLFIYGGVGLGKTHLMQAAGNAVVERAADARVVYVHSERFVADMVKALQHNEINNFKRYYRSLDVLLIDDIQFFAGKS